MFVLVRNVVEEVERKVLPNFGGHWRSSELAVGGATAEKMFLVGIFMRSVLE